MGGWGSVQGSQAACWARYNLCVQFWGGARGTAVSRAKKPLQLSFADTTGVGGRQHLRVRTHTSTPPAPRSPPDTHHVCVHLTPPPTPHPTALLPPPSGARAC